MTTATLDGITAVIDHKREWTERVDGRQKMSSLGKPRAYVQFTAEFNVLEDLVNRRNRPWQAVKPAVVKALRDAGVQFERIRWDQRAGCSCPCSPGFVLEGARYPNRYVDFYLKLEGMPST